jgi:hypothetical protein
MSRRRYGTPFVPVKNWRCQWFGHGTWEPDGYYCLRCGLSIDDWPLTGERLARRLYRALGWRIDRWWRWRRPSQHWPFFTRCVDCHKVDQVWTWAVGRHETCNPIPF